MVDTDELLDFWFGDALDSPEAALERNRVWFAGDERFDEEIRVRFGRLPERVMGEELSSGGLQPRPALARVIALDQLPRNLFRGSADAFAFDARARSLAQQALELGHDERLDPLEALFLYLPFEHSEDRSDQQRSVALHEELLRRGPSDQRALLELKLHFARRHSELIARFGRFPARNGALGRSSTPEELAYLEEGSDGF